MTTMKSRQDLEARSVAEQAAEWLLVLEDGKPEDHEAFSDWLAKSPLHVGAFLRASAVDSLLGEVDRERSIKVDAGPFRNEDPEVGRHAASRASGVARFRVMGWAIAACATLAAVTLAASLWTHHLSNPWEHYVAAVGEQRTLTLQDGSVVLLGPGSGIDVRYSANERQLRLVSGQAVFTVHKDATRPFRVRSGQTVVQALGTEFDVHQVRGDSVVSVIEGMVQVSHERSFIQTIASPVLGSGTAELRPVRVTAGHEIRIAGDGQAAAPVPVAVNPVQEMKARRLTFINETLYAIADEFNRYNPSPKIRIEDAAAGEQRYAAAFDADDPQSLVVVLEKDPKLQIERLPGEIVIRGR